MEQRGIPDVSEIEDEHDESFESETGSAMRRRTKIERGEILLHAFLGDP